MSIPADLDALLAKEDIRTLSRQYMRGLDRLDADLLRSEYFDDAQVDYGFYRGSAQQFVESAMRALRDHHANHHFIGQMSVDLEGDVAFGGDLLPGVPSPRRSRCRKKTSSLRVDTSTVTNGATASGESRSARK